jgi:hypothetical protein
VPLYPCGNADETRSPRSRMDPPRAVDRAVRAAPRNAQRIAQSTDSDQALSDSHPLDQQVVRRSHEIANRVDSSRLGEEGLDHRRRITGTRVAVGRDDGIRQPITVEIADDALIDDRRNPIAGELRDDARPANRGRMARGRLRCGGAASAGAGGMSAGGWRCRRGAAAHEDDNHKRDHRSDGEGDENRGEQSASHSEQRGRSRQGRGGRASRKRYLLDVAPPAKEGSPLRRVGRALGRSSASRGCHDALGESSCGHEEPCVSNHRVVRPNGQPLNVPGADKALPRPRLGESTAFTQCLDNPRQLSCRCYITTNDTTGYERRGDSIDAFPRRQHVEDDAIDIGHVE